MLLTIFLYKHQLTFVAFSCVLLQFAQTQKLLDFQTALFAIASAWRWNRELGQHRPSKEALALDELLAHLLGDRN